MKSYFVEIALLNQGWAKNVRVSVSENGIIQDVETDQALSADDICLSDKVLLPAPTNLHSHGFQRALAGLTEYRSGSSNDSFWTWRTLMYKFLEQLTPEQFTAINAYAQMEMLEAGYASLAEFHYVHNQKDGTKYDNPAELSDCVIEAASKSGIGLTLLPVYYAQGGVDGRPLQGGQLRFKNNLESYEQIWGHASQTAKYAREDFKLGIAPHSLRALSETDLVALAQTYSDVPKHIHIAEQLAEIDEIKAAYGKRPVEWLLEKVDVGPDWCLVHATHLTETENSDLAKSGAIAGLCPITEANLGDGIFPAVSFLKANGKIGVGTDSNVSISLVHELRMLEYSQRLQLKGRALLCDANKSTGRTLFDKTLEGGAQAAGRYCGKIAPGFQADFMTLNMKSDDLADLQGDYLLDSWIFASKDNLVEDVFSAGHHVVQNGQHIEAEKIISDFRTVMKELRSTL
ncbi:formimidoylglutamate deiminase [Sneathiella limimaris]|uniref:formimidoylglutamate deiminase n=1 Tax=Sneathiella limimaris TaxID=1964213 RepID=UPI00146E1564|nr:formimidoylglutamate deiminase [Sneathiella limimaris]